MKLHRPAPAIAAAFFVLCLVILLAGADHPPPPGFLWIVLLDLVAAGLVYWRVPTYAGWHADRQPGRLIRVLRDGAAAGLFFGLVTVAFARASRSLETTPAPGDIVTWSVVLTLVGVVCAVLVYACAALLSGRRASDR